MRSAKGLLAAASSITDPHCGRVPPQSGRADRGQPVLTAIVRSSSGEWLGPLPATQDRGCRPAEMQTLEWPLLLQKGRLPQGSQPDPPYQQQCAATGSRIWRAFPNVSVLLEKWFS